MIRRQFGDRDPVLTLSTALVGVAALVASFSTLAALAAFVGWQGRTTWLLPACLDALAIGAGRVWLSKRYDAEAREYARTTSLAALGVSVAGNAVGHIVALEHAAWWKVALAILVGAVPPVALAAVGHLLTLSTVPREVPAVVPDVVPAPAPVPVGIPESPAEVPQERPAQSRKRPASAGTGVAKARALWEAAPFDAKPSGAALARHAEVDPSLGRRWRREWAAEVVPA